MITRHRINKPFSLTKLDEHQDHDPDVAFLRSRLIDIRQWLKDQYLIYKEHCDLATFINTHYQRVDPAHTKKVYKKLMKKNSIITSERHNTENIQSITRETMTIYNKELKYN